MKKRFIIFNFLALVSSVLWFYFNFVSELSKAYSVHSTQSSSFTLSLPIFFIVIFFILLILSFFIVFSKKTQKIIILLVTLSVSFGVFYIERTNSKFQDEYWNERISILEEENNIFNGLSRDYTRSIDNILEPGEEGEMFLSFVNKNNIICIIDARYFSQGGVMDIFVIGQKVDDKLMVFDEEDIKKDPPYLDSLGVSIIDKYEIVEIEWDYNLIKKMEEDCGY